MVKNTDVVSVDCENGVTRKVLSHGGSLMNTEVTFKKGACGDTHLHEEYEQISYVVRGSFKYILGKETFYLEKGDSIYIPKKTLHGCEALEDNSVLLDSFTPMRTEWL